MARFVTSIPSSLDPVAAFGLVADFSTITDWDPGIVAAERLDAGELGLGSAFRLVSAFGPRRIPLTYVVREYDHGRRAVLDAVTGDFTSYDVITVEPTDGGSVLTYDATLTLHGWRRPADPLLQAAFAVIGRRAEAGLRRVLNPQAVAA